MTRTQKIKCEPEVLASLVDIVRDIESNVFWKQAYFYGRNEPQTRERDERAMEQAVKKARSLFRKYDSAQSFDTASPAIQYCLLDSNLPFSLEKLRKMVDETSSLDEQQMKQRLMAQEKILRASGVPVYLKPLIKRGLNIKSYVKKYYDKYYDLNARHTGGQVERIVFAGDTFFPDYIPVEASTRRATGKRYSFGEDETLRGVLACLKTEPNFENKAVNILI